MAVYSYTKSPVDLSRLQAECVSAGLPVAYINGSVIDSSIQINTSRDLTPQEIQTLDAVVASHDGRPRQKRPFIDIYNQINALTNQQKTAINNDLFGGPPANKWSRGNTPSTAAMAATYYSATVPNGITAAEKNTARLYIAAMYCYDNVNYLVRPSFDPTINVPGDEPIA
jgi:hypothetical protein